MSGRSEGWNIESKGRKATATDIIEEVKALICDSYCKYPQMYEKPEVHEALLDEHCSKCPLNWL